MFSKLALFVVLFAVAIVQIKGEFTQSGKFLRPSKQIMNKYELRLLKQVDFLVAVSTCLAITYSFHRKIHEYLVF